MPVESEKKPEEMSRDDLIFTVKSLTRALNLRGLAMKIAFIQSALAVVALLIGVTIAGNLRVGVDQTKEAAAVGRAENRYLICALAEDDYRDLTAEQQVVINDLCGSAEELEDAILSAREEQDASGG